MSEQQITTTGGCHCGAVRFEIETPADAHLIQCNCSICTMTGFLHLIVPGGDFRLVSGENDLVTYRFNTGTAKHLSCKKCGVKSYYIPRSHPDGFSVNFNCIDRTPFASVTTEAFDGQNWEANAGSLDPLPGD